MPDFGRWNNGGDPSLNEINRTDRFLDALANQEPVYATDASEADIAQLLAGWRDEIRTPPLMRPVTPRDATVALTRAVQARKRTRTSFAVVGSIAAAVLCIGGFGAVVAGAGPGDALYGLHTMLFGEQQQTRTDQVALASQQLAEVQQLIDEGQWDAAQDKLQTLTTTVATVDDSTQKQELVSQWQELTVKVDAKDANATLPPGAPPPPMPEPIVVAPESNTSTSASSDTSGSSASTSPSTVTTTPSSETSSATTTTSSTSSSPAPEPPPASNTPTTTTTPPTSTTTTTTTHAVTTTTTTTTQAPPIAGPPAGGGNVVGGAQDVAPPATIPQNPAPQNPVIQAPAPPSPAPAAPAPQAPAIQAPAPQNPVPQAPAPQSPATESQPAVTIPVTTTLEVPAPKKRGGD